MISSHAEHFTFICARFEILLLLLTALKNVIKSTPLSPLSLTRISVPVPQDNPHTLL